MTYCLAWNRTDTWLQLIYAQNRVYIGGYHPPGGYCKWLQYGHMHTAADHITQNLR